MLLTIYNLPSNYRYNDVKELIASKCGIRDLILDNLIPHGKSKKVTVGISDEVDAALIVRKVNGLYLGGQQLYVEDVRKKKASEQPYRPSSGRDEDQYQNTNQQQISNQHTMPLLQPSFMNMQMMNAPQMVPPPLMMTQPMMSGHNIQMDQYNTSYDMGQNTSYMGYSQQIPPLMSSMPQQPDESYQNNFGNNGNNDYENYYPENNKKLDKPKNKDHNRSRDSGDRYQNRSQPNSHDNYSRTDGRNRSPYQNRQFSNRSPQRDSRRRRSPPRDLGRRRSPPRDSERRRSPPRDVERSRSPKWSSQDGKSRNNNNGRGLGPENQSHFEPPRQNQSYDMPQNQSYDMPQMQSHQRPRNQMYQASNKKSYQTTQNQSSNSLTPFANQAIEPQPSSSSSFFGSHVVDNNQQRDTRPIKTQTWENRNYEARFAGPGGPKSNWLQKQKKSFRQKPGQNDQPNKFNPNANKNTFKGGKIEKPNNNKGKVVSLLNRDQAWRAQVAASIAKEVIAKDVKFEKRKYADILKQLKICIRSRLDLILTDKIGVSMTVMEADYRKKFPKSEDPDLLQHILENLPEVSKDNENEGEAKIKSEEQNESAEPDMPKPKVEKVVKSENVATAVKKEKEPVVPLFKFPPTNMKPAPDAPLPRFPMADKNIYRRNKKLQKMECDPNHDYKLDPELEKALDDEMNELIQIFTHECQEEEYPDDDEKKIAGKIASLANTEFKKVVKLHIKKRILNIRTNLVVRLYPIGGKVKKRDLDVFLRAYDVISLRKSVKAKIFIATCNSYEGYDQLLTLGSAVVAGSTVLIKPFQMIGSGGKETNKNKKVNKPNYSQIDNSNERAMANFADDDDEQFDEGGGDYDEEGDNDYDGNDDDMEENDEMGDKYDESGYNNMEVKKEEFKTENDTMEGNDEMNAYMDDENIGEDDLEDY